MNNRKTIILTGAGAAIPWGAPSTESITKSILSDTTFKSYTGQPIGSWLHHKLIGLYHKDPETVNFETIINAVEYFVTYFSSKEIQSVSKFKNLLPAFFMEKDDVWELLDFNKIYKNNINRWHSNNERYKFYGSWNNYEGFFRSVFKLFINIIIEEIEKYSRSIQEKNNLNHSLNEFLLSIKNPLRCYTTNYDRIIPSVFKGEIFEGFVKEGNELKFDANKVSLDETSNVYFNLHGSVHYEMDFPNNVKYTPEKFIYNFGSSTSNSRDQDKRSILNSNIITGFNKPSRILNNPYLQFYHRFYQDCLFADKIYIIGYSFGDIHINNVVKTASTINKDLKIICITRNDFFDNNSQTETDYDWTKYSEAYEVFDHIKLYESIGDKTNINRIQIYQRSYEKFLKTKQWEKES